MSIRLAIKLKKKISIMIVVSFIFLSFVNAENSYPPYAQKYYPTNVYWGDTHLHTNLSWDAYNFGNTNLGPEEAYRFAKGEAVIAHNGMQAQLSRPLDFLVVADHASNMGVMNGLARSDQVALSRPIGRRAAEKLADINRIAITDSETAEKLSDQLFLDGFMEGEIVDKNYRQAVWDDTSGQA